MPRRLLGELAHGLRELIYPRICWACRTALRQEQRDFCAVCRERLLCDRFPSCPRCSSSVGPHSDTTRGCVRCRDQKFQFEAVRRLGPYADLLRTLILSIKFVHYEGLAEALGRLWAERHAEVVRNWQPVALVPVPLHWWRHYRRGYNQSQAIARGIAQVLGVPCRPDLVRRVRATPKQMRRNPSERRVNVHDAFRARKARLGKGQTFLIIDDVLTTGSTAHEVARTLRQAGAARVMVGILGHD